MIKQDCGSSSREKHENIIELLNWELKALTQEDDNIMLSMSPGTPPLITNKSVIYCAEQSLHTVEDNKDSDLFLKLLTATNFFLPLKTFTVK